MERYDKYIDLEFGYTQPNTGREVLLNYNGSTDAAKGACCEHCGKKFTGKNKTVHSFTDDEFQGEWLFGGDCVKHVFGAGLVTLNQSEK